MANIYFVTGSKSKFDALEVKDLNTLYWIKDEETGKMSLYKGEDLVGTAAEATASAAGLMSAVDKAKLDKMSEGGQGGDVLTAGDASVLVEGEGGQKTIKVQLSKDKGNSLVLKGDGLFVQESAAQKVEIPEYSMEKQKAATDGYLSTYKLKKTVGGVSTYVGDEINLPKDLVIQSGDMKTVESPNVPYQGAQAGDMYIDLVLSDSSASHIYIPVKELIKPYTAGNGIDILENVVAVKLDMSSANGLKVAEGGLSLALATTESAGAMSAADKQALDNAVKALVWQELA